ncbi:glycosyltransferase [Gracilimonas sp.]|uniref:glycosyltransferase n=1 Tax=Gracilimonas sp. TaxID=1974203 RepID=UPI002872304A|nr:glycosyltransferase [Gracilimonas sp.]
MPKTPLKLLIVGKVWPEPNSSAAGSRMMQLIEVLKLITDSITFASAATENNYGVDLEKFGVKPVSIKLNDSSFDQFIANLNPDVVLFDRFMTEEQFGWRVAEHCPKALRILDTEDLHFLRKARQEAWKNNKGFEEADLYNDLAKREIASILRCDLSLIISKYEMKLLQEVFNVDKQLLLYVPFLLDKISYNTISNWKSIDNRKHFISIGNFLHEPNWNAVLYLKEEIWPLIRKQLPEAELHIYGAYPSQKVEQLHNEQEGFLVKGRAENAKEVVGNARVLLAPLRFGAGLKGKLVEAMQCGTPSVTTDIGAEGMHNDLPWPGAIENEATDFTKAAIELYRNDRNWEECQKAGVRIINELYRKDDFGSVLTDRIHKLIENMEKHRRQNFIGQILQHHTVASTKYMSKWIEAKNDR